MEAAPPPAGAGAGPEELRAEGVEPLLDAPALLHDVTRLRDEVAARSAALVARWRAWLERPEFAPNAANMAAYLALRCHDLRDLQRGLAALGVSSLGRVEGRVIANLDAVVATLAAVAGEPPRPRPSAAAFFEGEALLRAEKRRVFGASPDRRRVRIMVTLPEDATDHDPIDHDAVRPLVDAGMNVARINAARGDVDAWKAQADAVRWAAMDAGRPCAVVLDLPGAKLRVARVAWSDDGEPRLRRGEAFVLGESAAEHPEARACVTLSRPDVAARLRVGDEVWLDDGKLGGVVETTTADVVLVRVVRARAKGERLAENRGVNLPGVDLGPFALGPRDREALAFGAREADAIGLSFVDSAGDVETVQRALRELAPERPLPPVIVKIETRRAVAHLPEIIAVAAGRQPMAVMIARGDLAVEIGYRRLAEMQEEILWLCEAARVPVVWATQVLESLAKKGIPTRAEVTDAAMAERAECVMLNKGPFVAEAVRLLDDVLQRMETHQSKKTSRLRALGVWRHLV